MEILTYPDPRLKIRAETITDIDQSVRKLASDMIRTMHDAKGVGLAATQVGVAKRMAIINITGAKSDDRAFINPEIVDKSGFEASDEGCLSVPGIWAPVDRFSRVTVKALDLDGNEIAVKVEGLLAKAFQHEIDHLNGVLFIDRLAPMDREKVESEIRDLQKAFMPTHDTGSQ